MLEYSQNKRMGRPPTSKPIQTRSKSSSDLSKNLHVKSSSRESNEILSNNNFLIGWGRNRYHQYPYNVLDIQGAVDIACGQKHSLYLNQKYQLYVCGDNQHGQLGLSGVQYTDVPIRILKDKMIAQIYAGHYTSFVVTSKGQLITMGLNNRGQLGLGNDNDQRIPTVVQSLSISQNKIMTKDTSRGRINTVVGPNILTERQNGFDNIIKQQTPQKKNFNNNSKFFDASYEQSSTKLLLNDSEHIKQIGCGPFHTLLLTTKGRLFSSGLKLHELSEDAPNSKEFIQVKLKFNSLNNIQKISVGLTINSAITSQGRCFIWGAINEHIIVEPIMLDVRHVVDVSLGGQDINCVLTAKGDVFQFSDYNHERGYKIKRIQINHIIKHVFCGANFAIAFTQAKQIYGWGNNKYGQLLGPVAKDFYTTQTLQYINPVVIKMPGDITKIQCGSYHVLAICSKQYQKQQEKQMQQLEQYKKQNQELKALLKKKQKKSIKTQTDPVQKFENLINVNPRTFSTTLQINFSDLVLQKQISEGGYGIIYKGKWRQTVVAIKLFKIDGSSENSMKDFLSECHAMEALRHPNIVMFLGACTKPPHLCIVLEFCTKGTLWSILQSSVDLSWQDRRRFALDTAKGMNYLHSCQVPILHRDLKSLNLLLDQSYRVKLADFGWTKGLENYMTGKIGTYQWMAPQVISGQKYTQKADIFSFGIILWQIASREPPYRNVSGIQVSIEVANNDLRPIIPKKTPQQLTKLIKRCWDRNPEIRPSFKEIIKELQTMKLS